MISSGRPEFADQIWPLITHEDNQISLAALRAGTRFRPAVLGVDAKKRLGALPSSTRKNVLHEIASNSGMDGLDLVATIARVDPDSEVKATVVDALAFRRANHHIAEVLIDADNKTFDLVARKDLVDEIDDATIKHLLDAARARQQTHGVSAYERLRAILQMPGDENVTDKLTALVADIKIENDQDAAVHLIFEASSRYQQAIAEGILQRVREDRPLFYGADHLLAIANLSLEDDALLQVVLSETQRHNARADAAASVLGPQAVGFLIEAALKAKHNIRDVNGKFYQAKGDRYHNLLARIAHVPGKSLVSAVSERSKQAGLEEIADLADLISHHPESNDHRGRPFDADSRAVIGLLLFDWGNRMLSTSDSTRLQLASIAVMATRSPSVNLLPMLKRLLDEELRRYRAFREEAISVGWRQGKATDEARNIHTNKYQHAFLAINAPETAALMRSYLRDEYFGKEAALVLAAQWTAVNEPDEGSRFRWGVDFSRVGEKRATRTLDPTVSSTEGDAIFAAIDQLIEDEATNDQKRLAVDIGVVAARLPHGQRYATIKKLISMAQRRTRATLLQNLLLAGETLDIELIQNGLAEVFEAAKLQSWVLSDGYEVRDWLRLLPFVDSPLEVIATVRGLPKGQRTVDQLQEMIGGLGVASNKDAEEVLFELAELDPKLYADHAWQIAVIGRGSLSAAFRFLELAASGTFAGRNTDNFHMARQLGSLMAQYPEARAQVYKLMVSSEYANIPGLPILARAVSESPDSEGLLLLIKLEMEQNISYISWRTIESIVTEHVPSESWKGAYEVVAVPADELRRKLLALTTDGGPSDVGSQWLTCIDKIRDEYGIPDSESRHPDLASGKPWPIMRTALN